MRRRIVVIPQEGFLFTGTIRDNLRLAAPDADDARLRAALDDLGLTARFDRFPTASTRRSSTRGRTSRRVSASWCRSRARGLDRPVGARARRSDVEPRPGHRAAARPGARAVDGRAQRRRDRAPAHHRRARRPGRGGRRRPPRRGGHPRGARARTTGGTPRSTRRGRGGSPPAEVLRPPRGVPCRRGRHPRARRRRRRGRGEAAGALRGAAVPELPHAVHPVVHAHVLRHQRPADRPRLARHRAHRHQCGPRRRSSSRSGCRCSW